MQVDRQIEHRIEEQLGAAAVGGWRTAPVEATEEPKNLELFRPALAAGSAARLGAAKAVGKEAGRSSEYSSQRILTESIAILASWPGEAPMVAQAKGVWGSGHEVLCEQRDSYRAKSQVGLWCVEQVGLLETTIPR